MAIYFPLLLILRAADAPAYLSHVGRWMVLRLCIVVEPGAGRDPSAWWMTVGAYIGRVNTWL